jgi:hypothetical protein
VKPTSQAISEAKLNPGGSVLVVDGYDGPAEKVPPERVRGYWRVDANGKITGAFVPNLRYRPLEEFN